MSYPRLYILMRTDLDSMNPGKGMAQAAHAANAFMKDHGDVTVPGVEEWVNETPQGFGTTITLAVPDAKTLEDTVALAKVYGFPADVIHDPTYPVRDGGVVHLLPLDTCGYVFMPDGSVPINLPLHP